MYPLPKLSTSTILNDLAWPLTRISRSLYYSMSSNSKMVQDIYLQWQTNSQLYMVYWMAPFFNYLEESITQISRLRQYLMLNISEMVWDTDIVQWNTGTNRVLHALLKGVILNDLECLTETVNNTKHCMVSLRWLSFLFVWVLSIMSTVSAGPGSSRVGWIYFLARRH